MEYSGFFDGGQAYGQAEFNRYFGSIYESGISCEDDGKITLDVSLEGNTLRVNTGYAILKGFYFYNETVKSLKIVKDANYDRVDRVVIRLDSLNKKMELILKKGIPSVTPIAPALERSVDGDKIIHELSLAQVKITRAGVISILDERRDNNVCGLIRPKNLVEFNETMKEWNKSFNNWFNEQQSKSWRNIYIQSGEPVGSVNGSIWIQI